MFLCILCSKPLEDELWVIESIFEEEGATATDVLTVCAECRDKVLKNSAVVLQIQHWKKEVL